MKAIQAFAIYTVALLILTPFAGLSQARADDADLAQVLKTLRALEARVATLESEKQQYRREAASARAETQALKQKLGKQPNPNPPVRLPPPDSYAMATKAPLPAAVPTWGGFYAGASWDTDCHDYERGYQQDLRARLAYGDDWGVALFRYVLRSPWPSSRAMSRPPFARGLLLFRMQRGRLKRA